MLICSTGWGDVLIIILPSPSLLDRSATPKLRYRWWGHLCVTCPDIPSQLSPSSLQCNGREQQLLPANWRGNPPYRWARPFHVRPSLVYCKRAVGPVLLQPPVQAEWLASLPQTHSSKRRGAGVWQSVGGWWLGWPVREHVRSLGSLTAQSGSSNKEKKHWSQTRMARNHSHLSTHVIGLARCRGKARRPQWPALAVGERGTESGRGRWMPREIIKTAFLPLQSHGIPSHLYFWQPSNCLHLDDQQAPGPLFCSTWNSFSAPQ
jgi:hypothetical protein